MTKTIALSAVSALRATSGMRTIGSPPPAYTIKTG